MAYFDWLGPDDDADVEVSPPKPPPMKESAFAGDLKTGKRKKRIDISSLIPKDERQAVLLQKMYPQGVEPEDLQRPELAGVKVREGFYDPERLSQAMTAERSTERYRTPEEQAEVVAGHEQRAITPGKIFGGITKGLQKITGTDISGEEQYQKQLKEGETQRAIDEQNAFQAKQQATEAGTLEAPVPQGPPAPPEKKLHTRGGVGQLWKDFGIDDAAMYDRMEQGMKMLQQSMPMVQFNSPVGNMYAALASVTMALGPQAVQGVFGRMQQDLNKPSRLEKEAKRLEGQAAADEAMQSHDIEEYKRNARELAESGGLNSFGSILLFVLTSMVIGPKMAIYFFNDKVKRGELEAEKEQILARLDERRKRVQMDREMASQARMKSMGLKDEREFLMVEKDREEMHRWMRDRQKLQVLAQSKAATAEQKKVALSALELNRTIGSDLSAANALERDATEIERNDIGGARTKLVQSKRQQAAQLRTRSEANKERKHQLMEWMITNGMLDAGTEEETEE